MSYHDINFNAVTGPIFDPEGREIPGSMARGVYREDTGQILSVCGSAFKPVQHIDIVDPLLQTLKDQGNEIFERKAERRDLYDLKGQKGAFADIQVQDDGAVMRIDVITGDFVEPTGRSSYLDRGPDTMLRRFLGINSHNSSLAVRVSNSYQRVICMNGIVDPYFTASTYGKHTTNFNTDYLRQQIITAQEFMANDAETFGKYARTPLTAQQAEEFLKKTLAKLPDKPNGEPHFSERKVLELLGYFQDEDQTVWGLVQALTYWATHGDMRASSGAITGRIRRDADVAASMRSSEFRQLMAA